MLWQLLQKYQQVLIQHQHIKAAEQLNQRNTLIARRSRYMETASV